MTTGRGNELQDVIAAFQAVLQKDSARVSRDLVLQWMRSDDIQVMGAVYAHCTNPDYYLKIEPTLTAEDYFGFVKNYLVRCLVENPSGEWSNTRYEAGWALAGWFRNYWNEPSYPRRFAVELRDMLASITRNGDADVRLCVSTASWARCASRSWRA